MALTKDRLTPMMDGVTFRYPVKGGEKIFAGALVVLAAGFAAAGAAGVNLIAVGRAEHAADNTNGEDGDVQVTVRRGCFRFRSAADADALDRTHIGKVCYVADDETVAATHANNSRSAAGIVQDIDDDEVWVRI